jgi:hypothetical protein
MPAVYNNPVLGKRVRDRRQAFTANGSERYS